MPISHAHLRSFHAVATHGSFTRASEMLNITQPTLSGQVKELEERYGTKLFIRHGRRIELTDIGKSAFSITRLMFRHEEEVEHLLQSARALTSGQLRVGADSPYIATPLLAQFQRLYPGIQISIQYGNSQQLMAWIVSRSCDVAFMPNIPQEDERLYSIPLPYRQAGGVRQPGPRLGRAALGEDRGTGDAAYRAARKRFSYTLDISKRRFRGLESCYPMSWRLAGAKVYAKRSRLVLELVLLPRTNWSPTPGCAHYRLATPS